MYNRRLKSYDLVACVLKAIKDITLSIKFIVTPYVRAEEMRPKEIKLSSAHKDLLCSLPVRCNIFVSTFAFFQLIYKKWNKQLQK